MPRQRLTRFFFNLPFQALIGLGLILSLCLSALPSCTQQPGGVGSASEPIRIGLIAALTGTNIDTGKSLVDSAKLVADQVNGAGGLEVAGQQHLIELITVDEASSPEGAVRAAQNLINQENVVAIVGPLYSSSAIPVAKLAESAQIPMISPTSTNPETTADKQYVFRAVFIDPFQGDVLARFAYNELKHQTAAVLFDIASPYNKGIAEVFKQVFESVGGEVVAFESYTTGDTDYTSQLQRIKSANPQVLFLPNYENEVPQQAQKARELGIEATLIGGDAWSAIDADQLSIFEDSFFTGFFSLDLKSDQLEAFVKDFSATYGRKPNDYEAAVFDSFGILFQAIRTQGKVEPEAIRDGIANLGRYEGVTGSAEFRGTGDPLKSVIVHRIQNGVPTLYKQVNPEG